MEPITNKPKLIILSDLWGREKSGWIDLYVDCLQIKYSITYYDCCELGGVDKTNYTELSLHNQFVTGGIEKSVMNLLEKEKEEISVLAFSVGGIIAWKAALSGLKLKCLFAVSSTRLRYENKKPQARIELFFGEDDNYKPSTDWFLQMNLINQILKNETHEVYRKPVFAQKLSEYILLPSE